MHLPRGRYHRSRFSIVLLSFSKFPCEEKTRSNSSSRSLLSVRSLARSLAQVAAEAVKRFFFVLLLMGSEITFSPLSLLLCEVCARNTTITTTIIIITTTT